MKEEINTYLSSRSGIDRTEANQVSEGILVLRGVGNTNAAVRRAARNRLDESAIAPQGDLSIVISAKGQREGLSSLASDGVELVDELRRDCKRREVATGHEKRNDSRGTIESLRGGNERSGSGRKGHRDGLSVIEETSGHQVDVVRRASELATNQSNQERGNV